MIDSLYKLTKLGKRVAGSILPGKRDAILDYLYDQKTASPEEIANATGMDVARVKFLLKRFRRRRLVEELTRGD